MGEALALGAFMDRTGPRHALLLGTARAARVGVGYQFATAIAALFILQVILGLARPLGWSTASHTRRSCGVPRGGPWSASASSPWPWPSAETKRMGTASPAAEPTVPG